MALERLTEMPPSQRNIGPSTGLNICSLPSQRMSIPLTDAMASVIGKSQLLVCGAAIMTHFGGSGSSCVTFQRHRASQIRDNTRLIDPP